MEEIPQSQSALMVAFSNLQKFINDFRAHIDETEVDLAEFETAVDACQAQLEALEVELGQMAGGTSDESGKYMYRELMAAEKVIKKEIDEIRADRRITENVRTVMEESLQELLDQQAGLLASFRSDSSH
jgi:septal ring factor EnvC (AmiA/AmiB activator)